SHHARHSALLLLHYSLPYLSRAFSLVHIPRVLHFSLFFFNDTATTEIYTLSLHDALPILMGTLFAVADSTPKPVPHNFAMSARRSEEHTSELQSRENLVCRLLLEKKKRK